MHRYYALLSAVLLPCLSHSANISPHDHVLLSMVKDGCARPVVDDAEVLPAFPTKCMASFFTDTGHRVIDLPNRVKDWGSNGLVGKPWVFQDALCNEFFITLHERIAAMVPAIKLTPHDLFHGHLIAHGQHQQEHLAVVLHAKEYPSDLEVAKNRYQISSESFKTTDKEFMHRNFLYLTALAQEGRASTLRNEIYLIEDRGVCTNYFTGLHANTLSEQALAKALVGKILGDVNVFLPEKLRRIKYQFYSDIDPSTHQLIDDYEAVETGKNLTTRRYANTVIDVLIDQLLQKPLLYLVTGRDD